MATPLHKYIKFKNVSSLSTTSSIEMEELAELQDSFGYACHRAQNLALLEDTIIYTSGRVLHVLHPETQTISLRLCSRYARAIGHFATNRQYKHVAVGEEGTEPRIYVYQWPNFEVIAELKNGTRKAYVCLNYSPDGEILCSQGGEPDLTLALWDWKNQSLLLTCRPSEQPIYCVAYCHIQPDTIITSGRGHIGFWRTTRTFTGLKISGECGKFGATEVTDVSSFECLPGGKVASGCSWGNILIWSNARVEYEITTKRRDVPCHKAPVRAFHWLNDWLVTIGSDGWVRLWGMNDGKREEKDDRMLLRQESVLYFRVARGACLLSKVHDHTTPNDEVWFLQDGKGAIWRAAVGRALRGETPAPTVSPVLRCHAGAVIAAAACPYAARVATLGKDGKLLVRNYLEEFARSCVIERECKLPGSSLLWFPAEVDPSGSCIMAGFTNGVITMYCCGTTKLHELQSLRPHGGPVTALAVTTLTEGSSVLASGGSDATVCVVNIQQRSRPILYPLGLISVPGPVTTLCWRSECQEPVLLVCCEKGLVAEYVIETIRKVPQPLYLNILPRHSVSLSSLLVRENDITVVTGRYNTASSMITLALRDLEGWSAICELDISSGSLTSIHQLPTTQGAIMTCANITSTCDLAILGFNNGEIQVCLCAGEEMWQRFWRLALHEGETGSEVTAVTFTFDLENCFSCGVDGNEFLFRLSKQHVSDPPPFTPPSCKPYLTEKRTGLPARNLTLTMKQVRELKEERKLKRMIKNKKLNITKKLQELKERYTSLLQRHPDIIKTNEELHPRITSYQESEIASLRAQLLGETEEMLRNSEERWKRVYTHFIAPLHSDSLCVTMFREDCYVESYRLKKLDEDILRQNEDIKKRYEEEKMTRESLVHVSDLTLVSDSSSCVESELEETVTPEPARDTDEVGVTTLALERIKRHREQREARLKHLDELEAEKPNHGGVVQLSLEDKAKIREAESTIGDYRLKCDPEFPALPDLTVSPLRTLHELAQTKLEIFRVKNEFNKNIFALKSRKSYLIETWNKLLITNSDSNLLEMSDIMKLRDVEKNEKDLLKLCGGAGSEGNINIAVNESYEEISSSVALEKAIQQFDESVRAQLTERAHVDAQVCLLRLRVIGLRREALILEEFIPQERALEQRLKEARDDGAELHKQLAAIREQAKEHRRRVADLHREQRTLERRLFTEAGSSAFYSSLLSMIKTRPPSFSRASSTAGSSIDSDTGSGETCLARRRRSGGIISCPPGCDPNHFALASQLRLQRIEINNMIAEENKGIEFVNKEQEILIKRLNLLDNHIKNINEEINQFQRERQSRLDSLQEVVPVKLHQLPADARLADCVVMPREVLTKLRSRTHELRNDTIVLEQILAEDKKNLQTLILKRQQTESKIVALKMEIEETMRKRFGKVVNMEELEEAVLNTKQESVHISQLETKKRDHVIRLEKEKASLRKIELEAKKKKDDLMKRLTELLKENNDLTVVKLNKHANCSRTDQVVLEINVERLQEIYRSQKEQISALRQELGILRCKMTSSRDLFPAATTLSPRAVVSSLSEDNSEVTSGEQTPPGTPQRAREDSSSMSVAPEIVIQHCPDLEPDDE